MYEQFKAKAEGVSAEVHRFTTSADALAFLVDFLKEEGVADQDGQYCVVAAGPFVDGIDHEQLAAIPGVFFDVTRQQAAGARVGISQVDWALADIGTLVQDATAIDKRLVSTLPFIHVAMIATSGLRPDMTAWLTDANPNDAGYLAMITGPSRTADIERVLTIGVHGPARLVICFVDELGGTN
ncbi:LutC/YkgG family protein [Desulfobulbus oligotrophicus]|uniref:Lactate utilization protein n=1 Tax=Desulfobulbus oligotrophicus TaxID=1909699 RepID=A0A7T5VB06_9BACT|nr:lactate utilization protein [Desulfobulbus oligotrophicus]QQG64496.1 lactate utilization protein [Desulfobulbus oligotrophicus]